jgi:C4-dicarboxylate-specific signal transduction histidine kinase
LAEGLNEAPLLELAHANRLATGQLSVSIAHELNEPIAAAVANADAALHWLDARPPSLDRARQALGRILGNGHRASQIIAEMTTNVSI